MLGNKNWSPCIAKSVFRRAYSLSNYWRTLARTKTFCWAKTSLFLKTTWAQSLSCRTVTGHNREGFHLRDIQHHLIGQTCDWNFSLQIFYQCLACGDKCARCREEGSIFVKVVNFFARCGLKIKINGKWQIPHEFYILKNVCIF